MKVTPQVSEEDSSLTLFYVLLAVFGLFVAIGFIYIIIQLIKGYHSLWYIRSPGKPSTPTQKYIKPPINYHPPERLNAKRYPCGLKNNSSVCYINSMIQAAASSKLLIKGFEKIKPKNAENSSCYKFTNLLRSINESGNSTKAISRNTKLLEDLIRSVGWKKPSQQDAFDLFSTLIKAIENEIKTFGEFQIPMKFKLVHRFKGIGLHEKTQDHLGLSVGLCGEYSRRPGVSLRYLIKEHFSPTIIDDDPSKTTQMFFYQQAPDVILIHIQANKWDYERGEMYKPEYHIDYKENMNLTISVISEMNTEKVEKEVKYTLIGFVKHTGTISGGHYVTYRRFREKWFYVNDNRVKQWEYNSRNVPYIMIYEKTT